MPSLYGLEVGLNQPPMLGDPPAPPVGSYVIQEDSSYILMEDGSKILTEA